MSAPVGECAPGCGLVWVWPGPRGWSAPAGVPGPGGYPSMH